MEAEKSRVVVHALRMALGTSTSRVLGLLRESFFAAFFDRHVTDAWNVAFRLPNLFRRLFGEGSLSVSFVPVFVETRLKDESGGRTKRLNDGFFTLLVCFLSTLTVLGLLFPEAFLKILVDDSYVANVEAFALTVRLAQIMFGFVFLVCTYAYFMGILNALGRYGLPAMAPTLFNIAMIVSTLLPQTWFPTPGDGLAWGVIVGGFLQMAILVPALARAGHLPSISFHWGDPDIWKVLRNMGPGLIGLGLAQFTTLINTRFATSLGQGPVSWLNWADRLLELPLSLIAVSLGSALLPTLASFWARGERERMSDTMNFYLRLNLFACVAAAFGLYFLAGPIVEAVFFRGKFSLEDLAATTSVVQVWALIMIPTACVRVLAPSYYAVQNTWFPAAVSACCLVVHVILAPRLMDLYGLTGLNVSSLVSSSLNFFFLLVFYRVVVSDFRYGLLVKQFLKFLVPGAGLALAVQVHGPLRAALGSSFPAKVFCLGFAILLGLVVFGGISRLMGLEEWHSSAERVLQKLRQRRR